MSFHIDRNEELTAKALKSIIQSFETEQLPKFNNYLGYYMGHGQEIMRRVQPDPTRPNNRIVKNYCSSIVDNFQGYLTGTPITYAGKDNTNIDMLLGVLDDNDVINADSEFLRNALVYGMSYELCYVNENQEKKFKNIDPRCVIPIYSDDLDEDLLYCIYYYPMKNWENPDSSRVAINIYSDTTIQHYISDNQLSDIVLMGEEAHYFGEVPFVIFQLNQDHTNIFDRIINLQDAYNTLLSDEVNDFQAFVDAYMVLKNVQADSEDLAKMKETRTILIDGEDDISYLTKDISDTQIENMLDNINSSIHTISNSPDFSSEEFNSGVSSGIALQFKLVGFNNIASNIEARMTKALQRRIHLLNQIASLVDSTVYDVQISFKHNLPTSLTDTVQTVNGLRGLVSDKTLLSQIPFITDVDQELERLAEQDAGQAELYSFNAHGEEEDEEKKEVIADEEE